MKKIFVLPVISLAFSATSALLSEASSAVTVSPPAVVLETPTAPLFSPPQRFETWDERKRRLRAGYEGKDGWKQYKKQQKALWKQEKEQWKRQQKALWEQQHPGQSWKAYKRQQKALWKQ